MRLRFVAATAMLGAIPLVCARHLPIQDYPNVLAIVATLLRAGTPEFDRLFEVDWTLGPYTTFYAMTFVLAKVLGANAAVRSVVAIPMIGIPLAIGALGGRLRRDGEVAGLLAIPLLFTEAYFVGFHPFLWAMLFAVVAALALHEWLVTERSRAAVAFGILSVLAWSMHPSAPMMLAGFAGATALGTPFDRRRLLVAALALLPVALLSIRFFQDSQHFDPALPTIELKLPTELRYTALMPAFALSSSALVPQLVGPVAAASFALVALGGALASRGEPFPIARWFVPVGLFALSVPLPFAAGAVVWLDARVALVGWLALALMVTPPPAPASWLRRSWLALASLVVGATLVSVLASHVVFDRSMRPVDRLFARMGADATVVGLAFSRSQEAFVPISLRERQIPTFSLYAHFAALYHRDHGGRSPTMTFHPSLAWIPLRLREASFATRFPITSPFLSSRTLRSLSARSDGIDYVIVRRIRTEHRVLLASFADFLGVSGEFELYRVRTTHVEANESPVPSQVSPWHPRGARLPGVQ